MTVEELKAIADQPAVAKADVLALVEEVHRLQAREVELMQRALDAELEVQNLGKAWQKASEQRDEWRQSWVLAQAQVNRWMTTALTGQQS